MYINCITITFQALTLAPSASGFYGSGYRGDISLNGSPKRKIMRLTTTRWPILNIIAGTTTSPIQNPILPSWLDTLNNNNENITTPQGMQECAVPRAVLPHSATGNVIGGGPAYQPSNQISHSGYPARGRGFGANGPKANVPQWLETLQKSNKNIITVQGTFKLGHFGDVTTRPYCPKTPTNGTGVCKIIFDCPQIFSLLTDINVYLQYFCPLNEYAGVCCPQINPIS